MQRSNHHSHSLSRSIGGWFGAGLIGSTLLMVSPAAAADALSAWQFDPNTSQFTITLPQGIAPRVLVAAEPARIILEIPQTRLGQVDTEANYDGTVRSIRLLETEGNILQVVLELAPGTVFIPRPGPTYLGIGSGSDPLGAHPSGCGSGFSSDRNRAREQVYWR